MTGDDRGQFVLAAAALVVIALAPVVLAYLQLGYHPDVRASAEYDAPVTNAERVLERAVHEAGTVATDSRARRGPVVERVRADLDDTRAVLRASRVAAGTVYRTEYNDTAARQWAERRCPDGPNRQFGACRAVRGVVLQNRIDEVHVLAVAFDLTVVTERGRTELTLTVRV